MNTVQKPLLMIAEDEEAIVAVMEYNLRREGFRTMAVRDGADVVDAVYDHRPDMLLLDWMMPTVSGLDACVELRKKPETRGIPIIIITARGEESDRIKGLDSGADDYLVKPFSPSELLSRIRAVMRRTRPSLAAPKLECAGITVDFNTRKISYGNKPMHLGPTEFRLLTHFMEKPNQVFSREHLLDTVWGRDNLHVEIRTVDVHIRRLRKALADCEPSLEYLIKTVRSAGYMLEE